LSYFLCLFLESINIFSHKAGAYIGTFVYHSNAKFEVTLEVTRGNRCVKWGASVQVVFFKGEIGVWSVRRISLIEKSNELIGNRARDSLHIWVVPESYFSMRRVRDQKIFFHLRLFLLIALDE
jgi:hypothetical protein